MARPKKQYCDNYICFDIETTHEKVADVDIIYTWHWSMMDDNYNYATATSWADFYDYTLNYFNEHRKPGDTRMIVWVHNLGYELEAIIRNLEGHEITAGFHMDSHEPLYLEIDEKLEFRCTYKLTNKSLAACGKDVGLDKLEMNYADIVKPGESLPQSKEAYTYRDVEIMVKKIKQLEEQEGLSFKKFPYTNTGFLRNELREVMRGDYKWRNMFRKTKLNYDTYVMCRKAFQGGYVHANYIHAGRTLSDVDSFDFGSAYPFAIATEKFPCSPLQEMKGATIFDLLKLAKSDSYLFVCDVTFKDVRAKGNMTYLSLSRCEITDDTIVDNGRIFSAGMIRTTCTSLDLLILFRMYHIKAAKVNKCYYCRADYLPSGIVTTMLKYYNIKQSMKGVEGQELNYMKSKNRVNSFYGMFVQDPIHDVVTLTDTKWKVEHVAITDKEEITSQLNDFYKNRNSFLPYQIGIFIPAYIRYHLLFDIVSKIDRNVVYCDTDSAKVINREECMDVVNGYNAYVAYKIDLALKRYALDYKLPDLGVFDWETKKDGSWQKFRTYGAKKYIVLTGDNKLQMTVSGLNKKAVNFLHSVEDFKLYTTFVPGVSGRTISHPTTNPIDTYDNGGTWIEDTTYTLTISPEYAALIGIDIEEVKPRLVTRDGIVDNPDTEIKKRIDRFSKKLLAKAPMLEGKVPRGTF